MAQQCEALAYIHNVSWKGKRPTLDARGSFCIGWAIPRNG